MKRRTFPELLTSSRCLLVVLAGEVGGRWSDTCVWLLRKLAEHRCEKAPKRLRKSMERGWKNQWWGMLAVAAQDSLAATLVEDAPHLLHGWAGPNPPLADLLYGEAPNPTRLPLR